MRLFQAWHDRPIEQQIEGMESRLSHRLHNIERELKIMSKAEDDLNAAIVNLGLAVAGATDKIAAEAEAIRAANVNNDPLIEAAAQKINDLALSLNTSVAAAQPAPAPAPAEPAAPAPAPAEAPSAPAPDAAPAPSEDQAPAPAQTDPAAPAS